MSMQAKVDAAGRILVHPLTVRVTHWINVVAMLIMIFSGWRIYNADPLFPFKFPAELTLGGWLAGALQWHFAAMWLLALNGLIYLGYGLVSGLVLWKPVQFHALGMLMGDYEGVRYVHFFAMAALVAFVFVHVLMVALVPRTLPSMFTGRIKTKVAS